MKRTFPRKFTAAAVAVGATTATLAVMTPAVSADPIKIGYYDMYAAQGVDQQVLPIQAAGAIPVQIFDLTAAELAGIDVLAVQNPNNFDLGAEYKAQRLVVQAAVNNGMELVIHDRFVGPADIGSIQPSAADSLPGGAGFDMQREFSDHRDIDVRDNTTLVTNGPGGVVDNTTLDNGNSSSHGFTISGSLPGDSVKIFSRSNPDEIVNMCYRFGSGSVMYSSIPLDWYLGGSSNFATIYAPNAMAYGAAGMCSGVDDTTPPELTLPGSQTVEATGPDGRVVTYAASASDATDGTVPVTCTPASGSTFALGATTVNCSATDAASNTANGSFDVTVQDTTAPALTLPNDKVAEATGHNGAVVSYTTSATDVVDGTVPVSCTPSGDIFALGATTVDCSATDAAGNTASGSFDVTVVDTTIPTLDLPGNRTVNATAPNGAVVTYTATASDVADPNPSLVCEPASGATFGIGTTTVTCTATDAASNVASGSFTVTTVGAAQQLVNLRTLILSYALPAETQLSLLDKVTGAQQKLAAGRTADACTKLSDLVKKVNQLASRNRLSAARATQLRTDAARIRAVLGC